MDDKNFKLTEKEIKKHKLKHKPKLKEIGSFLRDILEFHPCSHAEIAAICDAAKVGIPVRNATLYTTTYPCHLCAKDIITAGIEKVVYLEAYLKSINKELYFNLIHIDPSFESDRFKLIAYSGVSPKHYYTLYSLENRQKEQVRTIFACEVIKYYTTRESEVADHLERLLDNRVLKIQQKTQKDCKTKYLCNLIHPNNKKKMHNHLKLIIL